LCNTVKFLLIAIISLNIISCHKEAGNKSLPVKINNKVISRAITDTSRNKHIAVYYQKVCPSYPEYKFSFYPDSSVEYFDSIVITSNNRLIQKIDLSEDSNNPCYHVRWIEGSDFSLTDYNFDNYGDLSLFLGTGFPHNESYLIYLFNPKTNKFEYNEKLNSLLNVYPDSASKTISSEYNETHDQPLDEVYKWVNGRLVLIERESVVRAGHSFKGDETEYWVYTHERRIRGKLKVIEKRKIIDYDSIPNKRY
jgi:hypothetical protein